MSYEYNDRGIRTKKTVGSVVTEYHLIGSRVTWESDGTNTLYYYYNGAGDLFGLSHNGVKCYYVKNAQGDIIRILDDAGAVVVEYTYDTWGKVLSITGSAASTIGELNPYRYRSYRYDTETGFYYLNSRYYDPEVGRFINADAISGFYGALNTGNMFAYCNSNPVSKYDVEGLCAYYLEMTYSLGVGLGVSQTVAVVWDDKGSLYFTKSSTELLDPYHIVVGYGGGLSFSAGFSGLDTAIDYIENLTHSIEGSGKLGIGIVGKADFSAEYEPIGVSVGATVGFGGGVAKHGNRTDIIVDGGYSPVHEYYGVPRTTGTRSNQSSARASSGSTSGVGTGNNYFVAW